MTPLTDAQLIEEARRADQQWSHEEVLALCHALRRALERHQPKPDDDRRGGLAMIRE